MRQFLAAGIAIFATACAHAPAPVAGPPDYSAIASQPTPKAALYADCIAQAVENKTYGRAHDSDTELVLFTCAGPPARAFYEALGPRSVEIQSEARIGMLTYRSTNAVQQNLFGVDYCHTDGRDYGCVLSFNAGEFLRP